VSADAGRHGPTDEGKPANWRRDAEVTQAMTDVWSRDLLLRHDRTQFRSLQAAHKPGAPPPPLPLRPRVSRDSRARDSRESQRPSSAHGMHGRSMSAAGTMRPSSAAELRSSGMNPSASQPALVRQSSHSSLASSKKSMMSIEQQLHALHPAMADAHMTDKGVLICKGPPELQNQLSRRNHIPRVIVDPEQAKINRLQAKLAQERATFQIKLDALNKTMGKKELYYSLAGEPIPITRPNPAKMQPLIAESFQGLTRIARSPPYGKPKPKPKPEPKANKGKQRGPPKPAANKKAPPKPPPAPVLLLWEEDWAKSSTERATFTPTTTGQPPLSETLKTSKGVRMLTDLDELLEQ